MEYRRLYIAYGSNINLEQMANRCPNSKVVGKEMLKGYELEFRGVATIVPNDKSEVPVLIWEIDGRDEHSLDRYEGFPNLYRKELFEIEVDGEKKECMAYLMNKGQISPPTSYYYNVIKQGYEANGMDTSYLRAALECLVCFDKLQKDIFDCEGEEMYVKCRNFNKKCGENRLDDKSIFLCNLSKYVVIMYILESMYKVKTG